MVDELEAVLYTNETGASDARDAVSAAREIASRLRSSSAVSNALKAEAAERDQNDHYSALVEELRSGMSAHNADFEALTEESDRFVVVQWSGAGTPNLRQLGVFGVLNPAGVPPSDTGAYPGLRRCLDDCAARIEIFVPSQSGAEWPMLQVAAFVYVRDNDVWLLRLGFMQVGNEIRMPSQLSQRFSQIEGAFRLSLETTRRRAFSAGSQLGELGIQLATEFMSHLVDGRPLADPATWAANRNPD